MSAITEKATLGQRIRFDRSLVRQRLNDCNDSREWREVGCGPQEGVLVGSRTLWNGTVHTEYFDASDGGGYHSTFAGTSTVPAFLVAVALNRKPILIPQHAATTPNAMNDFLDFRHLARVSLAKFNVNVACFYGSADTATATGEDMYWVKAKGQGLPTAGFSAGHVHYTAAVDALGRRLKEHQRQQQADRVARAQERQPVAA